MDTQIPPETFLHMCHFTRHHMKESDDSVHNDANTQSLALHQVLVMLIKHMESKCQSPPWQLTSLHSPHVVHRGRVSVTTNYHELFSAVGI